MRWALAAAAALACAEPAPPPDAGARPPVPQAPVALPAPEIPLAEVSNGIRRLVEAGRIPPLPPASAAERGWLDRLYGEAGHAPLWLTAQGVPREVAREALRLLAGATAEGLDPREYGRSALDTLAAALPGVPPDAGALARFDAGLTLAVSRYLRHLHGGRVDPNAIGFRIRSGAERHDLPALLGAGLRDGTLRSITADLSPPATPYRALRDALARYRLIAQVWPRDSLALALPVRPGDTTAALAGLWFRLALLGDLPPGARPPADPGVYDPDLVTAVERFQRRHGQTADGVIGRETLADLATPIEWRVRQLELALERLRWLPDLSSGPFLLVNIPMFELAAWDSLTPAGTPSLRIGVIVGKALDTETPVLSEEMRYLVFRPYWNVPPSIVRNEILPALARDSLYLRKQNMEIVQGPGDDAQAVATTPETVALLRRGQLRVRQRPGPGNSLGLVKFIFPNDEAVYLHGTPAQELFSRSRRDFSHGCVRVEDPVALASFVLRHRPEWTEETIRGAMQGPSPRRVNLPRPLPVILFYSTAAAEPDGTVRFARDIYGHDRTLDRARRARGGG